MMSEDRRHKNKQTKHCIAEMSDAMRYLLTPPLVNVFTNGSVLQSVATAAAGHLLLRVTITNNGWKTAINKIWALIMLTAFMTGCQSTRSHSSSGGAGGSVSIVTSNGWQVLRQAGGCDPNVRRPPVSHHLSYEPRWHLPFGLHIKVNMAPQIK